MTLARRSARPFAAAFAVACIAGAPAASAMQAPATGELSPRLAELASPALRSASPHQQAKELGLLAHGPGSLLRQGERVVAYVRFDRGALAGVDDLRAAGARIVGTSRQRQVDTVAALPAQLREVAAVPGVAAVIPALAPIARTAPGPSAASTPYAPCFGDDTSEGDAQLRADAARAEFEVAGSATKVGILSDSFDRDAVAPTGAGEDVLSGDLPGGGNPCGEPTPTQVVDDGEAEGEDEGRAMAQIVHDLAPAATLAFATAFIDEESFAANIKALAADGAQVIVDDVSYLEDPFFQEGPLGVAISEVTEADHVTYFSAAGNDNLFDVEGREIGSWEAPEFRDAGSCPAAVAALPASLHPSHCMNFDPNAANPVDRTFWIAVEPGEPLTVDLQWAEPWEGVTTDLDAYLLSENGSLLAGSIENNVAETQRPFEAIGWENESSSTRFVRLVINKRSGPGARLKFVLAQNGGGVEAVEYPESAEGDVVGPTIFGHNGGEDAISVGAVRFNATSKPEFFSSRGPVTHYFGPVAGTDPAPPLGPEELAKPDLVATDGGANTFFGSCGGAGPWRFFGTSAAAPHAAAAAALALEASPAASPAEIKQALVDGAVAVGGSLPAEVGAGLIDVPASLEALGVLPVDPGAEPAQPPSPGACKGPRTSGKPTTLGPSPAATPIVEEPAGTRPPRTFLRAHPPHLVLTRHQRARVLFRFGSNERHASFVCRIDNGLFRPCPARLVRFLPVGWHSLRVSARNAQGLGDRTPAFFRFRIKRVG